jgi:hypothetical protein
MFLKVLLALPACLILSACQDGRRGEKEGEVAEPLVRIGEPKVTPDPEDRAQVTVNWPLQAPCPCEKVKATQEIKGYIEFEDQSGAKNKTTARAIVSKNISTIPAGASKEVDDFKSGPGDPTKPDKSESEFIPDIGKHGTSTYPPNLFKCENIAGGKSKLELTDQPGTTARAGPGKPWKTIKIRLVFRTTVHCDGKAIFSFIWHIKHDLPSGGTNPEVKLGE